MNSAVRGYLLNFSVFALAVSSTSLAYAGFEWIPPVEQKPEVQVQERQPIAPPPVMQAPQQSMQNAPQPLSIDMSDDAMLPLPDLDGEPVAQPVVPAQQMPQMQNKAVIHSLKGVEADIEPIVKQPVIMPGDAPEATPIVQDSPKQDVVVEEIKVQKEPEVVIKRRIVVPEDAPESAKLSVENAVDTLVISPFPEGENVQFDGAVDEPSVMEEIKFVEETPAPETSETLQNLEAASKDVVVGFGKDMPLALALQQVVPAHYSYSFAVSVNPGQRVSWSGGEPWMDVVKTMIEPLNLTVDVKGKVVHVRTQNIPETISEVAPVMAPEEKPALEPESNLELPPLPPIGPEDLSLNSAQDLPLIDEDTMARDDHRQNIQDPGEAEMSQSEQVIEVLEEVAIIDEESQPLVEEVIKTKEKQPIESLVDSILLSSKSAPELWQAKQGDSLKQTLSEWSKNSEFDLVWEADYDYRLQADVMASGDFQEALKIVFENGLDKNNTPALVFVGGNQDSARPKLIVKDSQTS